MTAKELYSLMMHCRKEERTPQIPGLDIQIYWDDPFERFSISPIGEAERYSVTFMHMRPEDQYLQVEIYDEDHGSNKETLEKKRYGRTDDWKWGEEISVLPSRFPTWRLEKIVEPLKVRYMKEERK